MILVKLKSTQIFIQPPVNCNDMNTNIDSGDENEADRDASDFEWLSVTRMCCFGNEINKRQSSER